MTDQNVQLTLRADATLEHPLVDALLTFQPAVPFQVQTVKSFHAHQTLTTISDQVAGHLPQIRVTIETTENAWSAILAHIKNDLSHAEIQYWVMPVITHGQLSMT
ncbi:DUF3240 family protein [Hydrogenovibrio halophilus]|uniref:DUF3240 family protein n=1 Tax=Hydrogenovibrio halophilus TaxID=373391 RepID=UPI000380DE70|nr:DUF3240 family protein [Hydrogenovibrio halophilus]